MVYGPNGGPSIRAAIAALAREPILLLILLLNVVAIGGGAYILQRQAEARNAALTVLIERCFAQRSQP